MKKILCALLVFLSVLTMLPDGTGGWKMRAKADELPVTQIAAGSSSSFALFADGSLYGWGENYNGQLGDGKSVNKKTPSKLGTGYTAIAAGFSHNLFLKGNVLYSCGYNEDGQLGNGTRKNSLTQVKIGTGYTAIAAGGFHSLALKGNALYAWGSNYYGQLGDGTNTDRTKPVLIGTGYTAIAAGWYYSLALKGSDLYAWGNNELGQLGDGTNAHRNTPLKIGTGYTAIAAGSAHCLALKGNDLYTWGSGWRGTLGDGTGDDRNTPLKIGTGYTAIAAGPCSYFTLALMGDTLYTWGDNLYGQLGDGNTNTSLHLPVQIGTGYTAIAAGAFFSLALKGNAIYSWGYNSSGQLGNGTKVNKKTPAEVKINLPAKGIKLDKTSVKIVVGESVTLNATISPSNTLNKNVTWSSSNKNIASVSSNGVVTGVKAGRATITAKTVNGKTAKCVVTVIPLPSRVTLNRTTMTIIAGKSFTLKATVAPSNANDKTITWTSSDEAIATVCSQGKVTGVSIGSTTITAITVNGKTAKCVVKVLSK